MSIVTTWMSLKDIWSSDRKQAQNIKQWVSFISEPKIVDLIGVWGSGHWSLERKGVGGEPKME